MSDDVIEHGFREGDKVWVEDADGRRHPGIFEPDHRHIARQIGKGQDVADAGGECENGLHPALVIEQRRVAIAGDDIVGVDRIRAVTRRAVDKRDVRFGKRFLEHRGNMRRLVDRCADVDAHQG